MPDRTSCGARLRAFREQRGISLREAARQLHVVHPALKEWEDGRQTPAPAYREAIERWTHGEIPSSAWPLSAREREVVERASSVKPWTESGEHAAVDSVTSETG